MKAIKIILKTVLLISLTIHEDHLLHLKKRMSLQDI